MKIITQDTSAPIEHEFEFTNNGSLQKIFTHLGYHEFVRVSKNRTSFTKDNITVEIDDVDQLGRFVEIEVLIDQDATDQAKQSILIIQKLLGIEDSQIEPQKYDRLIKNLQNS